MFCIIGEKVLKCEVKKKEEMSSVCRVGDSKKDQIISNNRLFETHEEGMAFLKKKKTNQVNENKLVANAVEKCTALYEKLEEETGIEVRTIDRQWTINGAEKHIAKLIKTLSDKPETHDKNVSKSFYMAPDKKKSNKKFEPRNTGGSGASRGPKDAKSFSPKQDKPHGKTFSPKMAPKKSFHTKKGK